MEKRGFTLIEMLAVIVIISILAVLTVPGIMIIRKNILNNSYESNVSIIENAAIDYAHDHITELKSPVDSAYDGTKKKDDANCIYRNINFLINNGYISSTNRYIESDEYGKPVRENQLVDPRTGESMNNKIVCIRFDINDAINRKVIAYLVSEE